MQSGPAMANLPRAWNTSGESLAKRLREGLSVSTRTSLSSGCVLPECRCETVLRDIPPRILALVVLALVRARRGDPGPQPLLDEAWRLAEPTGELPRLGPVAAAKAELAWLEGDHAAVDQATRSALPLALQLKASWLTGELAVWRRRAGLDWTIPAGAAVAEPYALELGGEPRGAADLWREKGCPYEAAIAQLGVEDDELQRDALERLQRMEARPAAAMVARRLRQRGVRGLPRGPRASPAKTWEI